MDRPYQRVAAHLRRLIDDGDWPPGHRIPSWRTLASQYEVGQGAIRLAVQELRSEGLIEGHQRSRLTVAYRPAVRVLKDPDAEWPHGRGEVRSGECRADAGLSRWLQVPQLTAVHWKHTELLDPDGRPALLLQTWQQGDTARPHVSHRCEVRASTLSREDAALLGLAPGMATLVVARTRYGADGGPVQAAHLVLPADRWHVAL